MNGTLFKIVECTLKDELEKKVTELIKKGFVVHGDLQVDTRVNSKNESTKYYRILVVSYAYTC